jgi:hypothetical protein
MPSYSRSVTPSPGTEDDLGPDAIIQMRALKKRFGEVDAARDVVSWGSSVRPTRPHPVMQILAFRWRPKQSGSAKTLSIRLC